MRLGLIGYGSIAQALVARLPAGRVSHVTVLVRDTFAADAVPVGDNGVQVDFVTSLEALLDSLPQVVVECAGHGAVANHAAKILLHGTDVVVASVGALADEGLHRELEIAAERGKSALILPSGAIGGLDLLRVLSGADRVQVTYRGVKPPAAWKGSPADSLVDLGALSDRTVFYTGSGRAAAIRFPKNANVVAALALAGAGFDHMKVELVADPGARSNTHSFEVTSPNCTYTIEIENIATPGNARTSMTTVLSILHEVLNRTR